MPLGRPETDSYGPAKRLGPVGALFAFLAAGSGRPDFMKDEIMANSHDPQVYRELLTQFRDGYANFGKPPAFWNLQGLTEAKRFLLSEGERECLLKKLGYFSWPIGPVDQAEERGLWVWAALAHPFYTRKPKIRAFSLEAVKCFRTLAERAGAHLPQNVRDPVPGDARDAPSRWYRLLWWLPVVDHSDDKTIRGAGTTVSFSPFEDSITAIEVCGLAGDSPAFPFRVRFADDGNLIVEADGTKVDGKTPRKKRSTEPGEAQTKIIAALTKHHQYDNGSCLNPEPIGNNELARLAGVDQATASAFFKKQFEGHAKYKVACTDAGRFAAALKLLNGEYSPCLLYGSKPPGEDDREDG